MNKISLHAEGISDVTIIPNIFIDQYMPSASGAYVKVYLYLLRCFSGNCPEITISLIADHLENTEKDIIRALHYWEKLALLELIRNGQNEITSINLIDLNSSLMRGIDQEAEPVAKELAASLNTSSKSEVKRKKPKIKQNYSAEEIAQLTENEEIQYAMHIIEIYLNRPLKPMDMQLILYLYEELQFKADLIMYLYEYCVSKGKKNTSYIETVALGWAEEGIDTEEKARASTAAYNDHFLTVNKAFGLNRAPGQIERQYITKWVDIYGFNDEILTEACNRTLLRTGKPDFKYADKILETWSKKGVKNKMDIEKTDEEFMKGNKSFAAKKVTPIAKPSTNKFNQFPQRNYTAKDYAELERKLLNKGL